MDPRASEVDFKPVKKVRSLVVGPEQPVVEGPRGRATFTTDCYGFLRC